MFEAESGFLSHCILQANWSMSILLAHYENAKIIEMKKKKDYRNELWCPGLCRFWDLNPSPHACPDETFCFLQMEPYPSKTAEFRH